MPLTCATHTRATHTRADEQRGAQFAGLYRARLVLSHYRGFAEPQDERYQRWVDAMFEHPAFVATTSDDELYLDSYARYAENRPKTSQVADAINNGTPLP